MSSLTSRAVHFDLKDFSPYNGRGREVLDELRPYLKSDGGDCKIVDIDGPLVKLELMGACSSCSASSTTMKMGIEKLGHSTYH